MKKPLILCAVSLCLGGVPLILQAEEHTEAPQIQEGTDLVEEGMRLLFEGLLNELKPTLDEMKEYGETLGPKFKQLQELMGNIDEYQAPEILPNGDILIRRKRPLKEGEIEL